MSFKCPHWPQGEPTSYSFPQDEHRVWRLPTQREGSDSAESRPGGHVCTARATHLLGDQDSMGAGFAGRRFPWATASSGERHLSRASEGPATLPYVGCRCLCDPSHINATIRAGIYADFRAAPGLCRSSSSSQHCWLRDMIPFYFGGQAGRGREGETHVAETER